MALCASPAPGSAARTAAGIPASKTDTLESRGRPIGRPFYLLAGRRLISALHLHDLIHRQHVVVEVRHDPERAADHEEDNEKPEGER
jgi:hypothetical protein